MADRPLIVIGAGGRIGRLLRLIWQKAPPLHCRPVFLTRQEWDIDQGPAPAHLPRGGVVLDLAALRDAEGMALNPVLAARVARFATDGGHALVHMSSAAVYAGGGLPLAETAPTAPHSAYGASKLAAEVALRAECPGALVLRLANLAGADALSGQPAGQGVMLDPIADGTRGPVRSYIGPLTLGTVLAVLCDRRAGGDLAGTILNIAQPGPVAMADLLKAQGRDWQFGPPRPGVLDRMILSTDRLERLLPLPPATAEGLVQEMRLCAGWP